MDPEDEHVETSESIRGDALGVMHRSASFAPATVSEEARTVELVFTAGATRRMMTWDGDRFDEELEVSEEAIRMDRLNNGAPLLLDHLAATRFQVGVVESARIENGQGIAVVRFSKRAEADEVFRDVQDGILRGVSVGYKVHRYIREDRESDVPLLRAVDWEPAEISLVSIPADAAATVRSEGSSPTTTPNIPRAAGASNEERSMDPDLTPGVQNVDTAAIARRAADDERARAADIRSAVRSVGLADTVADELVTAGTPIEQARADILAAVATRQAQTDTRTGAAVIIRDERETLVERAADALYSRATRTAPTDAGRELRGLKLSEMARQFAGSGTSVSASQAVDAALSQRSGMHSTSDFAHVLSDVVGRTLRRSYETAPRTYLPFVREVELTDFRPVSRVQLGDHPALEKVVEGAEFKYGTIGDSAESYALATYGKLVSISRQAIVNDDLSAFNRIPEMQGRASADMESDLVYAILSQNSAMSDGKALFHTSHANVITAGLDVNGLGKVRAMGRKQTTTDGKKLNISFVTLIVHPDDEHAALQLLGSITPNSSGEFNPYIGSMKIAADPRVTPGQYHVAADPAVIDTIEIGYLAGARGLQTFTRDGWDVDGVEVKSRLDVGAKAIDWRGMAKANIPAG